MTRLLLALLVVLTLLALTDAAGKKKAKRCGRLIKKFEKCLKKGYQSEGCISGDGTLKKKELKRCKRIAKRVKKCDYSCKKPEPTTEPKPEPTPPPPPYDMKCQ